MPLLSAHGIFGERQMCGWYFMGFLYLLRKEVTKDETLPDCKLYFNSNIQYIIACFYAI